MTFNYCICWNVTRNCYYIWLSKNFKEDFKEFQRRFRNIYKFTLLLFQALFKRGIKNKTKIDESSLLHIFYYILQYTIIPSLTKQFEVMVTATLRKNLGHPIPKQNNDSCIQEDQESYSTRTFLCPVKLI